MSGAQTTDRAHQSLPPREGALGLAGPSSGANPTEPSLLARPTRERIMPPTMSDQATPDDAQIILRLYDLRREAVMRASRKLIMGWRPESYEDFATLATFGSEPNEAFRQVSSYFEMAYGFARRGAVQPELLAESCGEGLLLFAKVRPYLERFREERAPHAFRNAEWVVQNTEAGAARLAYFEQALARS